MLRSVDELHEIWLAEMASFTWKYQTNAAGGNPSTGYVLSVPWDQENVFKCDGKFDLPPGSGKLAQRMALFSRCTLSKPKSIEGTTLDDLPQSTFCLKSLLLAAFPKDTATNVFKPHDCAIAVADLPAPEGGFRAEFSAFGGFGVVLMSQCRRLLAPLAPDEEIFFLVDGKFLSIIE